MAIARRFVLTNASRVNKTMTDEHRKTVIKSVSLVDGCVWGVRVGKDLGKRCVLTSPEWKSELVMEGESDDDEGDEMN